MSSMAASSRVAHTFVTSRPMKLLGRSLGQQLPCRAVNRLVTSGHEAPAGSVGGMVIIVLILIFLALFIGLPVIGLAAWALISAAIVGLVIGGLGRLVIPGRQPIGLLATALLGLIGSIVGGFIGYHVLRIGGLSILLEIGIAAAAVAMYAHRPGQGRRLGPGGGPGSLSRFS
jgi:uncharacterized membrane protein YeaQ/YmgE (transglycosylase-associated protein family)